MREAAQAALKEHGFDDPKADIWKVTPHPGTADSEESPEAEAEESETPAAREADASQDSGDEESPDPEAGQQPDPDPDETLEAPSTEGEDEYPDEYFGFNKADFDPETWKQVVDRFRDQDKVIQSRQRELAELKRQEKPQAPPAEAEAEEPEGEETPEFEDPMEAAKSIDLDKLMVHYGYSPEDDTYELNKEMLEPLLRRQAANEIAQAWEAEEHQVAQFEQYWTSTLDQLEKDHGKLPYSRDEILNQAVELNVLDPTDIYNRLARQGETQMKAIVEEASKEVKQKAKPPSANRPRAATGQYAKDRNKLMTPKEAAQAAAEELGISWDEAL